MIRYIVPLLLIAVSALAQSGAGLESTNGPCSGGCIGTGLGYTGPGDIVSGATTFYGLRAYNAAYATGTNNAINVRRASDNTTQNIVILSNGNLNTTTAATFAGTDATASCTISGTTATCTGASGTINVNDPVAGVGLTQPCVVASASQTAPTLEIAGTSTSCGTIGSAETLTFQGALFVTEAYDQSGSGNNAVQATAGDQPQLLLNCLSSLPCFSMQAGDFLNSTTGTGTLPLSIEMVADRTSSFANFGNILSYANTTNFGFDNSANTIYIYNGGSFATLSSVNDSQWHAIQFVTNNGASTSFPSADGTSASLQSGGAGGGTGIYFPYAGSVGALVTEMGAWSGTTFSTGQISSICHNQHTYWTTPISC